MTHVPGLTRRNWLIPGLLSGLAVALIGPVNAAAPDSAGSTSPGVGLSAQHEELTLFEFMGHIDQNGNELVAYGYLTHLSGVPDADLFTGPPFSETTAKYTFVSTGTLDNRFIAGRVFNLVVTDSATTYYYRPAGGAGCIGIPGPGCVPGPAPFSTGEAFAAGSGRDSFTNVVLAPGTGLVSGTAEFQFESLSFKSAGIPSFPLWKLGTNVRVTYMGQATLTDPVVPTSFSIIAGRGTVLK